MSEQTSSTEFSNGPLPQKDSFSFQEVAALVEVRPYVLRFWETEFVKIRPTFDSGGGKSYSKKDIEAILQIKSLLFERKLSIPSAKIELDRQLETPVEALEAEKDEVIAEQHLRPETLNLLKNLLGQVQGLKRSLL